MKAASACIECLRRSWLLALLGPYIERTVPVDSALGTPPVLALCNQSLVELAAPNVAGQLLARIAALSEKRLGEELEAAGSWAICRCSDRYPASLRDLDDAPWALIGRGDPNLLANLTPSGTVAVRGARRASPYGREVARQLSHGLGAARLVVVSGLAFGIDACAHRGAMEEGRTIAVLGCGPNIAYPVSHRSLWRQVTENGLVLSELPPGGLPYRWTFPARNRIIAALAGMTVIVEAAQHSASLLSADVAAALGRELGAVPGPVTARTSAGPNALLAKGACIVRDAQDVLDVLGGFRNQRRSGGSSRQGSPPADRRR